MLVALIIPHTTGMRHIVTSFVDPLAPPYFSTLSHKQHDFLKMLLKLKMCGLICSTNLSKIFLILKLIQRDTVINVKSLHVKYPLFLSDFYET